MQRHVAAGVFAFRNAYTISHKTKRAAVTHGFRPRCRLVGEGRNRQQDEASCPRITIRSDSAGRAPRRTPHFATLRHLVLLPPVTECDHHSHHSPPLSPEIEATGTSPTPFASTPYNSPPNQPPTGHTGCENGTAIASCAPARECGSEVIAPQPPCRNNLVALWVQPSGKCCSINRIRLSVLLSNIKTTHVRELRPVPRGGMQ